jgi:hypothetical protein
MKVGQKILIEDSIIGVVHEIDPITGNPTKAKVGDKIIDITGKAIKVLTWILQLVKLIKSFIK